MKTLRKTIMHLTNTLRLRNDRPNQSSLKTIQAAKMDSGESIRVSKTDERISKLSSSYLAIKRLTYQQWQ
ncbi:MAG: hypothetical protein WDZ38_02060 [Balneolaceae bacterium]